VESSPGVSDERERRKKTRGGANGLAVATTFFATALAAIETTLSRLGGEQPR
jgi:hypothetical protein